MSTGVDRQDVVRLVTAVHPTSCLATSRRTSTPQSPTASTTTSARGVNVVAFGSVAPFPLLNSAWTEFGGRLGYRFSRNLAADAFLLGTLGGEIGPTLHGGLGVRYAF